MSGIFDEFGGSLTADVLNYNPDAIPAPDMLVIHMTRGKRRIADELRGQFGGFERVIIDVDGERHEFRAESLIRLLEKYEGAHGTRWHELFGTPERAARTVLSLDYCYEDCDKCPAFEICGLHSKFGRTVYEMAEWLRGDA
jgi:hypothetical protein